MRKFQSSILNLLFALIVAVTVVNRGCSDHITLDTRPRRSLALPAAASTRISAIASFCAAVVCLFAVIATAAPSVVTSALTSATAAVTAACDVTGDGVAVAFTL